MIAMAKRREDPKGKKTVRNPECNLDGDFVSRVKSVKDLSAANIQDALLHSRYVQILLSLTFIGSLLRFYHLGFNSLWLDEASTYTFAVNSFQGIWQATTSGEFNPPLFYWLEHIMLGVGNNEAILRFIPAVAGVLTIPLIYFVGKGFLDRTTGLIAAAVFAFSPFLIYYSQEARAYSLMFFFVAFGLLFYLKALKDNRLVNWVLFGILSALAFWSHFYAIVIIGALVLYALAIQLGNIKENLQNLKMLIISVVIFSVASLPLILLGVQLFTSRTGGGPTFGVQGFDVIYQTFLQVAGFNELVMFILVILFILGIIQAFRIDSKQGIFLVTLTLLTFLISLVLSYRIPMVPRYLIFFTAIFVLGVALSYRLLYSLVNHKGVVYGLIILLIVVNLPVLISFYTGYTKDDWRGFSQTMEQTAKPGDFIVMVPGYIAQPFDYYYSNSTAGTFEFGANDANTLAALESQKRAGKTNVSTYYIVTGDIYSANPAGDALTWLNVHTTALGRDTGISLWISN
ncbi:MAG: glycosyltransferase family 39 protein [Methanoregula sp.]|nr:glycosyltransferase family 39 protein [Methanoregula sp.]